MLKRLTNSKMKSSVSQYVTSFINSSIPLTLSRLQKIQTTMLMIGKMYPISNLARLSVLTDGSGIQHTYKILATVRERVVNTFFHL